MAMWAGLQRPARRSRLVEMSPGRITTRPMDALPAGAREWHTNVDLDHFDRWPGIPLCFAQSPAEVGHQGGSGRLGALIDHPIAGQIKDCICHQRWAAPAVAA
jgi:hypothetical protein